MLSRGLGGLSPAKCGQSTGVPVRAITPRSLLPGEPIADMLAGETPVAGSVHGAIVERKLEKNRPRVHCFLHHYDSRTDSRAAQFME